MTIDDELRTEKTAPNFVEERTMEENEKIQNDEEKKLANKDESISGNEKPKLLRLIGVVLVVMGVILFIVGLLVNIPSPTAVDAHLTIIKETDSNLQLKAEGISNLTRVKFRLMYTETSPIKWIKKNWQDYRIFDLDKSDLKAGKYIIKYVACIVPYHKFELNPIDSGELHYTMNPVSRSANETPSISSLEAYPKSPQPSGMKILWTARVKDLADYQIEYRFGVFDSRREIWNYYDWQENDKWYWNTTSLDKGTNKIKVCIRDKRSQNENPQNCSGETIYEIIPPIQQETKNLPPEITDFYCQPRSVKFGSEAKCEVIAGDEEGDKILYRFSAAPQENDFKGEKEFQSWSESKYSRFDPADPGWYKIWAYVKDEKHPNIEGSRKYDKIYFIR